MQEELKNAKYNKRLLNRFFVTAMVIVESIFLSIIIFSVYYFWKHADEGQMIFKLLPVVIIVLWLGIVVGYLAWAIYFYNINFGLTDEDWVHLKARVKAAKDKVEMGLVVDPKELIVPNQSPCKHDTFGLPSGTIRGLLAMTLLMGAISMFIFSMGMDFTIEGSGFFVDNFEFMKTAFLMMIAFYFGSRSLKYLNREKVTSLEGGNDNYQTTRGSETNYTNTSSHHVNQGGRQTASPDSFEIPSVTPQSQEVSPSELKDILIQQATKTTVPPLTSTETDQPQIDQELLLQHYPQVENENIRKVLSDEDIEVAAKTMGVEYAALKAVIHVETGGSGFLKNGSPKILFEGHIFWKKLKEIGKKPRDYSDDHPNIVYKKWDRSKYIGGEGEYTRLATAKLINEAAALESTSWGMFQIMGFNYTLIKDATGKAKYNSVQAFVENQLKSEAAQLEDFVMFMHTNGYTEFLKDKKWGKFARKYNGSGFKKNHYDTKLEKAFELYSQH